MTGGDRRVRLFFRKENRVLRRADFLEAYAKGVRHRFPMGQVFVLPREHPDQPTRLGLTASRKVGGAVVRNRLRRLARESFRMALPSLLPGRTIVVNFYQSAAVTDFATLRDQLHKAWRKAGLWKPEP